VNKKLVYAAFGITIISSTGKILGLIRESSFAAYFGASSNTDAFKIAFSIPDIFIAIFSAAIAQVFIPVYCDILKEGNPDKTQRFLNNIFTLIAIASATIVLLGIILRGPLVDLIAPGFDEASKRSAMEMVIIMFPGALFMIMANLVSGYLQVHERFISSSLIWYSYNICIISSLVLFHKFGIKVAAVGALFGLIGMLLIQLPSLVWQGFRYRPVIDFKDDGFRMISMLILPVLISSAFNQVYNVINRMLASNLGQGSISALDYAGRVSILINTVFIVSIATVIYPSLAKQSDCIPQFNATLASSTRLASMISFPLATILLILRKPIIQVLFERGAFSALDTKMTAGVLGFLSIAVIGITHREFLNRAFFALKDTRTPMINGIIAIGLNIILNLILVQCMGINGLALGTSIASLLSAYMLLIRLYRKQESISKSLISEGFIKSFIAAAIMGLVVFIGEKLLLNIMHLDGNTLLRLVNIMLACCIGGVVYIGFLAILKVHEIREGFYLVRKKLREAF